MGSLDFTDITPKRRIGAMEGRLRVYPKELNSMGPEERKVHKEALMRKHIRYMHDHSPEYYQDKFKECGAQPEDIRTIEDLRKLPVMMDKDAERQSMETSLEKYGHPFGLHVCCDPADVISTGGTSGTTGHPTYPYTMTAQDVEESSESIGWMHRVLGLAAATGPFSFSLWACTPPPPFSRASARRGFYRWI